MKPKKCFKCGEVKDVSEFYRHPRMGDGHLGKCKTCTKRDVRERYERKKKDPEWLARERARCIAKSKRDYHKAKEKNPDRFRAHSVLSNAVQRGDIVKPGECSRCGTKLPRARIHGHHDDYAHPLDVVWVCASCNIALHKANNSNWPF